MKICVWRYALIGVTLKGLPLIASTWATPVIEPTPGEPQIAVHKDGNMVVLSESDNGQTHVVEASIYDHSANAWSPPINLSTAELNAHKYRLAVDPVGNAVAIWQVTDGTYDKIQASIYSKATNTWSSVKDISEMEEGLLITHLAMDESGNIFAAWKEQLETYDLMWTVTYSSADKKWSKARAKKVIKEEDMRDEVFFDSSANAFVILNRKTMTGYRISGDQMPQTSERQRKPGGQKQEMAESLLEAVLR